MDRSKLKSRMGTSRKASVTSSASSSSTGDSPKLLNSFMWNDRDCNAKNHFICEKPMEDVLGIGNEDVDEVNQNLAATGK